MTGEEYLRRVGFWLNDLPWSTKQELLSELRGHLAELPEGTDLGSLGPPEQYAADMRAAAGLERRRGLIASLRARRPRNLILAAVTVTAIGLAIGAVVWIDRYQPLVFGNGSQDPPGVRPQLGSDGEEVAFRQGKLFEVGVSVVNNGRFTVRVLGAAPQPWLPLSARLYLAGPMANHGGFPRPHRRFRPFELAPGQVAFLVLRGTYDAKCHPRPGVQSFWTVGGFEVRFAFLWKTGTAEIALPSPLQIDGPKGKSCDRAQAVAGK